MVASKLNPELCYFIGALQSDGTIYLFRNKKRNLNLYRMRWQVGEKSLPMLRYLQKIFSTELDRKLKIVQAEINYYGTRIYSLGMGINTLRPTFRLLGIKKKGIPKNVATNKRFFCAYLAGLIDGDGDIRIKRPRYPQCEIRITAKRPSRRLNELIRKHLACGTRIQKLCCNSVIEGRPVFGSGYQQSFYVSSKNIRTFKKYVDPHICIKHKKSTLRKFYRIKKWA